MNTCELCVVMGHDVGGEACQICSLTNPCFGCSDYDLEHDCCISNGGCYIDD